MDHPDLAQLAAVVAAAGAALLLAGRGRAMVLGGLVVLSVGEAVLAGTGSDVSRFDRLASPAGAVAVLLGLAVLGAAAAVLVRRPGWVPLAVLVAAPLRPPITLSGGGAFPIGIAEDGQLGRLLPLYFVLAAAALALAWRALRPDQRGTLPVRALPRTVALPAAGFIALSCVSLLWADRIADGVDLLTFFTLPFALLLGVVGRSPFPDWEPRALARVGVGLAALFAAVGLYQAATRELFFFSPNLQVSNANSDFFRVTSLFGDPSLYGRHVVLGIVILLVALALGRLGARLGIALLVLLWAGLFFSYSQSSMVALVAVTLAVAAATGGPRVRRAVIAGFALVALLGAGFLASVVIRGESLRRETADRSRRVSDTARVIERHPLIGVGVGGQPAASRRVSKRPDEPTPNFVSHTAPLTVSAELGVLGLALYAWLLIAGARMLAAVRRLEPGLGLALLAAYLALFVHSLFYPGFLEDPITWLVPALGAAYLTWPRRDEGTPRAHEAVRVEAAA